MITNQPTSGTRQPSGRPPGRIPVGDALVSGRTLRLLLTVATALLFTAAVMGANLDIGMFRLLVIIGLVVGVSWAPDGPVPLIACGFAIITMFSGELTVNWWLVAVPTLLHAVHVLAALAAVVPARASVERAALAPSVRRFGLAQAIALPIVVTAGLFLV